MSCNYNYKGKWVSEQELFNIYNTTYKGKDDGIFNKDTPGIPERLNKARFDRVANKVKNTFAKEGILVDVYENQLLNTSARLISKDGGAAIEVNPEAMNVHSIFHEAGHLYVDLIQDQTLLEDGINQLRNTELWENIEMLYPQYEGTMLAKEVLTTAIGMEATKLFEKNEQRANWQVWLDRVYNKIASIFLMFGLHLEKDTVKRIAKDLVYGDISFRLDRRRAIVEQHLKDQSLIKYLNSINAFLAKKLENLERISHQLNRAEHRSDLKNLRLVADRLERTLSEKSAYETISGTMAMIAYDIGKLNNLEIKVDDLVTKYEGKGFLDTMTEKDLKHLSKTLNELREFHATLMPLEGTIEILSPEIIEQIPEDTLREDINKLNTSLSEYQKDMLYRSGLLYNEYTKLSTAVVTYILNLSSNPEWRNSDIYQKAETMMKEGFIDQSVIQTFLDSILDSNNPFVANLTNWIRVNLTEAELRYEVYTSQFKDAYSKFLDHGGVLSEVIDKKGYFHRQYKIKDMYDLYNQKKEEAEAKGEKYNMRDFIDEAATYTMPDGSPYSYEAFKEYVGEMQERTELKENDPNYLRPDQYRLWLKRNVKEMYDENSENIYPKLGGVFLVPKDEFITDGWKAMENNANAKEFHSFMTEMFDYLTEHLGYAIQQDWALPAYSKDLTELEMEVSEEGRIDQERTTVEGDFSYMIPLKYVGKLNQKPVYREIRQYIGEPMDQYEKRVLEDAKIKGFGSFETLDALKEFMQERIKENKDNATKGISLDLNNSIPLFIESTLAHKFKSEVEATMLLGYSILKHKKVLKRSGIGQRVLDYYGTKVHGTAEYAAEQSPNITKHLAFEIVSNFYQQRENRVGDKFLGAVKNYTSLLGIGFNIFSAIKNVTYGEYMAVAEANAGYHFSKKDLMDAHSQYIRNTGDFLKDGYGYEVKDNFVLGVLKTFDILGTIRDTFEEDFKVSKVHKAKEVLWKLAYAMQGGGEHVMYSTIILAMMRSHRVVDGVAMSFQDYLNYKGFGGKIKSKKRYELSKRERKEAISEIKKTKEEYLVEFEKDYSRLIDSLESKGGIVVSKKDADGNDVISFRELARFKEKNRGVAHKIHGIYNKPDKGMIEATKLGELIMQFRHWARPGWVKRFGARGGLFRIDEYWNERRREQDIGSYKSLWKLVFKQVGKERVDYYKEKQGKESLGVMGSAAVVLSTMKELMMHYKYHMWNMTETDRANIRRVYAELIMLYANIAAIAVLASAIPPGDERRKNRYFGMLLYQLDASRVELTTFLPRGWFNEGLKMLSNPTATLRTMVDAYDFANALMRYPFIADDKRRYQAGAFKGQLKVQRMGLKLIPLASPVQRWWALGKHEYKAYAYK